MSPCKTPQILVTGEQCLQISNLKGYYYHCQSDKNNQFTKHIKIFQDNHTTSSLKNHNAEHVNVEAFNL
jgi:hypothetical protein